MKNLLKLFIITALFMTITSCKNEPEVDKSNPFFRKFNTPFNVPPFEKIMVKHYLPAFEKGMAEGRKEIDKIVKNSKEPTFKNTINALDRSGDLLTKVTNVFSAQISANTNDSLQNLDLEIRPKLAAFRDEIRLNPELFKRVKSVYENKGKFNLNDEQKFLLENLYKEFVRNGANLNQTDQDTLKKINQKLAVLCVKFNQNVLDETNSYKLFVGKADLNGLPESLITSAAEVAKSTGQEGKWAFTTQRPSIFPFMTYSANRNLRNEIFHAYTNRGNNHNNFDNNKILAEIVKLRAQRAKLLGYKTHADLVLEPRMAKKPENVFNLLNNLWGKAIPVAENEVKEMQKIIDKEGGSFKLGPSDWWYYAEKLRKQKYSLNDTELRPYFKLENVREGLFTCANKLFGITLNPIPGCPVPHPDALAYEVKDADGSHLGVLYMDFFPRESKEQGAWCGGYRGHHVLDGKTITPVVTVVYNFTPPSGDTPSLLSLEEVSTMFHEFGHALDALFNLNTYNQTYVAWDFVELPSQLMEHWCTEPELLNIYARHYQTGEPIPASLIEKIKNSGYFNQGFDNVEVLAASLLDMAYYTLEAPVNIDIQSFEKDYFTKIGLIPEIVSRYRSTYFLHIIDEYDAGYYCYTWAAVLDNDAFETFKEKGIFDRATAESYRKNILAKNGIMDAMQMYVNFRGHEPQIEPLLKNRGLLTQ
ncbi:MAG: M3 family metallopeptidase [Bacteroidia bacterium]|nr:M3 family metallopeptidase [Bacteroidia bacterium]